MAFIREKEEIKTGFQEIEPWSSEIDLQTDFVMVYGLNESLESRMQQYRERGYKVHLMQKMRLQRNVTERLQISWDLVETLWMRRLIF